MFFEVASPPSFPKILSSLMRHVCAFVLQGRYTWKWEDQPK